MAESYKWYEDYNESAIKIIIKLMGVKNHDELYDCTPEGEDDPNELWDLPNTPEYEVIASFDNVSTKNFNIGLIKLLVNDKIAIQNASPIQILGKRND